LNYTVEGARLDPNVALQKFQALYARDVRAVHATTHQQKGVWRKALRRVE
jgi:hypothetical protein